MVANKPTFATVGPQVIAWIQARATNGSPAYMLAHNAKR